MDSFQNIFMKAVSFNKLFQILLHHFRWGKVKHVDFELIIFKGPFVRWISIWVWKKSILPRTFFLPEIFFCQRLFLSGQTFVKRGCCNNVQTPKALKKTLKSKCLQKQIVKNYFFIDFVLEDLFWKFNWYLQVKLQK